MHACIYVYSLNIFSILVHPLLLPVAEGADTHVERNQYLMFLIVFEWQESSKQMLRQSEATICRIM
jgi:hypothetical protein